MHSRQPQPHSVRYNCNLSLDPESSSPSPSRTTYWAPRRSSPPQIGLSRHEIAALCRIGALTYKDGIRTVAEVTRDPSPRSKPCAHHRTFRQTGPHQPIKVVFLLGGERMERGDDLVAAHLGLWLGLWSGGMHWGEGSLKRVGSGGSLSTV